MSNDLICDIYEALELMKLTRPVYLAVLRETGDKNQALDAIKYIAKIEKGPISGPSLFLPK